MNLIIKFFTLSILISNASIVAADYEVRNERLQLGLDAVILAQGKQKSAELDKHFLEKIKTALTKITEEFPDLKDIHAQLPIAPNRLLLNLIDDFYVTTHEELDGLNSRFVTNSKYTLLTVLLDLKEVDINIVKKLYEDKCSNDIRTVKLMERYDNPTSNIELDTESQSYWIFTLIDEHLNKHFIYFDQNKLKILKRVDLK